MTSFGRSMNRASLTSPNLKDVRRAISFFGLPEDADESATRQSMSDAQALRERLIVGEDFAVLAKEHSEDPGSSGNGGSLGYFERGDMVPVFESTAFALQIDEISEVVRSRFGLHIIKLTGIQEGRTKTFDEARDEVEEDFRRTQAEQLYYEQLEQLEILAFEIPGTLEVPADELGLEVKRIPQFTRAGSTTDLVGAEPKVVEAAFSDDVLLSGNNSSAIALPNNRAIVLRVAEYEPARPQTLEEARESIVSHLKDEQARAEILQLAEDSIVNLADGASRESLAEQLGIEWISHSEVDRQSDSVSRAVIEKVFELSRPIAGSESYASVTTFTGDQVLLALIAVAEGISESLESEQKRAIETKLLGDYGRSAFDAYVQTLREQADIVVNEESFER